MTVNPSLRPLPSRRVIDPCEHAVGGSGLTLTVNGGSFVSASVVRWNGGAADDVCQRHTHPGGNLGGRYCGCRHRTGHRLHTRPGGRDIIAATLRLSRPRG